VDKGVNLLGLTVWHGLSYKGLIGLFFFEGAWPYVTQHSSDIHFTAINQFYGKKPFYFNKMAHHYTTTETSEATLMKPCQVNGQDEHVVLSIPHAHLIEPPSTFICGGP
jgi:hypothetical protein